MHIKTFIFCICLYQFICCEVQAQIATFNGWFFSNHEQELSKKMSFLSDIQFRSGDQFKDVETVLLRFGLQYKRSEIQSTAIGYAYLGNQQETNGNKSFDLEHRTWEQYSVKLKWGKTETSQRLRLEQRFLQAHNGFDFVQRLRYYIRTQIPLIKGKDFKKGAFLGLQNEVFLNILHNENTNNRIFDQNRAFGSFGYRFSENMDIELGYLYRYQIEEEKLQNHILQLVVATSL